METNELGNLIHIGHYLHKKSRHVFCLLFYDTFSSGGKGFSSPVPSPELPPSPVFSSPSPVASDPEPPEPEPEPPPDPDDPPSEPLPDPLPVPLFSSLEPVPPPGGVVLVVPLSP